MNNLGTLTDELFKQLRALDGKKNDELRLEINKSKAVVGVANAITDVAKLTLAVENYRDMQADRYEVIPTLLEVESYEKDV